MTRNLAPLALLGMALCVGACGGADERSLSAKGPAAPQLSYEEFRKHNVTVDPELGLPVVENDIVMPDEASVRRYYDSFFSSPQALTVREIGANLNVDDIWSRTDRFNITFCVSSNLGSNQAQMLTSALKAMAAWESAADVRFVHVASEDSNCYAGNPKIKLPIVRGPDSMAGTADCGFPSYDPSIRQLRINWPTGTTFSDQLLTAVAMHELGHGLGFRHEHIRDPGAAAAKCAEGSDWRALTPYDGMSVMHYPTCPGWTDKSWAWNFMTQWDIEGAQAVYGAPTNVINFNDGTLFARQRSTGNLFLRSGAGWVQIGGPGQAFVAVGDTLYGQIPGRGAPVKWNGLSQGWSVIGGPAGQIFNCGSALCATDPNNGSVARYFGGSWTTIGAAGARFQATDLGAGQLFAITPNEHSVALWNGGNVGWGIVGGDASEIFGGGFNMFRLTTDRASIQRYDGPNAWTTIGGAGRQFLPDASALYALTPDAANVVSFYNGSWSFIGGAAARLYGTNGELYATAPGDESIWQFNPGPNNWTFLGHP